VQARRSKLPFLFLLLVVMLAASMYLVMVGQADDDEAPSAETPALSDHVASAEAAVIVEQQVGKVLIDDKPLATLYTLTPDLTGLARAEIAAERLNRLLKEGFTAGDILPLKQNGVWVVAIKEVAVMTATTVDAQPAGKSPKSLAIDWQKRLIERLFPEARKPSSENYEDWSTKIVPLLSLGSGLRLGAVQVSGPKEKLSQCKAVVVIEGEFKSKFRAKALVPVGSTSTRKLDRIQGIGVTGLLDVKL